MAGDTESSLPDEKTVSSADMTSAGGEPCSLVGNVERGVFSWRLEVGETGREAAGREKQSRDSCVTGDMMMSCDK